jgi:hypothetical protein
MGIILRTNEIGYIAMYLTVFPVNPKERFIAHDNGT